MSHRKHAWAAYFDAHGEGDTQAVEAAVIADFIDDLTDSLTDLGESLSTSPDVLTGLRLAVREMERVADAWTEGAK